jgi:putative transposase
LENSFVVETGVRNCPDCGHIEDRDLNAAKNIDRWFENIFIPDSVRAASSLLRSGSESTSVTVRKRKVCGEGLRPQNFVRTVSSTEIACGVDKPLKSHLETTLKQEVNAKTTFVQLSLDLGSFG